MNPAGQAAEQAAIRQDNLRGALEQLSGAVETAAIALGTPLLAGPGAIVATMVFVHGIDDAPDLLAVAAAIVAVHVVMWVSLRYSVLILRVLRDGGITLVTRIAGLLLSAIAVQLVADAVIAFADSAG